METFAKSILQPYPLLIFALGIALLRLRKVSCDRRATWRTALIAYLLIYTFSTGAFEHAIFQSIESGYETRLDAPFADDVIVLLTGDMKRASSMRPYDELGATSLYRCHHAAKLYHLQPVKIIVSGGKVDPTVAGRACSEVMRDCLVDLGVRAEDITVEDQSRSTAESATECRRLFGDDSAHRVLLVTEAYHMRRAVDAFVDAGLEHVVPAPCMRRATEFRWRAEKFIPNAGALADVHLATHELIGSAWYRATQWVAH